MSLTLHCLAVASLLGPAVQDQESWEEFGDLLGASLASLGDVDGDGRGDFAVGAPADRLDVGCVWLVSGAKGLSVRCLEGPQGAKRFGHELCVVGDANGDELPDLAVGSIEGGGVIRIYSSADGKLLLAIEGTEIGRSLGPFTCVGDANADGVSDLAVICEDDGLVRDVLLLSGKDGSVLRTIAAATILELKATHGDVAGCGDLDGDGVPDLLVGMDEGPEGAHRAVVLSGADGTPVFLMNVPKQRGAQRSCVCLAGDVDGDSVPDLAVATPQQVFFGNEENVPLASVTVHSGRDGRVLLRPSFPEEGRGLRFGHSMAMAGDTDEDGHEDFVVAAPGFFSGVVLYGGADGAVLHHWPARSRRGFGESVTVLEDVDRDGVSDVAIGVAIWTSPTEPGAVLVCSGKDGRELYEISTKTLR